MGLRFKRKMTHIVHDLCVTNNDLLNNDFKLYLEVLKTIYGDELIKGASLHTFLMNAQDLKAPSFETVTRARRFIQQVLINKIDSKTIEERTDNIEETLEWLGYRGIDES